MSSSTSRFASSMSSSWPVSFHQPLTLWLSTRSAAVDQPLDCVGDLELAPPDGSIAFAASKIDGPNM